MTRPCHCELSESWLWRSGAQMFLQIVSSGHQPGYAVGPVNEEQSS